MLGGHSKCYKRGASSELCVHREEPASDGAAHHRGVCGSSAAAAQCHGCG